MLHHLYCVLIFNSSLGCVLWKGKHEISASAHLQQFSFLLLFGKPAKMQFSLEFHTQCQVFPHPGTKLGTASIISSSVIYSKLCFMKLWSGWLCREPAFKAAKLRQHGMNQLLQESWESFPGESDQGWVLCSYENAVRLGSYWSYFLKNKLFPFKGNPL